MKIFLTILFYVILETKGNRTAVLLSGQLRSANLSWSSGKIFQNTHSRLFGKDDPPTVAGLPYYYSFLIIFYQ